jgi:hypothetical protein
MPTLYMPGIYLHVCKKFNILRVLVCREPIRHSYFILAQRQRLLYTRTFLQQTNHIRCVISYLLARSSERLINGCSVARDRQRLTVIEDRPSLSYVNEQQFDPQGNYTEISMKEHIVKVEIC